MLFSWLFVVLADFMPFSSTAASPSARSLLDDVVSDSMYFHA
jgi:hypothetical protein